MNASYLQRFLSDTARSATASDIRELLKVIARPEVISLAGGLPPPEAFPIPDLAEMIPGVLREYGATALQYGTTEGDVDLRQELIKLMAEVEGDAFARLTPEHVLVTSASQQGLDLCSRMFLRRYDAVVCGLPSYLGALGAFTACGARLCGVPLDDDGIRVDLLEQRLVDLRRQGIRPKFVYTVPDFQNPAGVSLSLERRLQILAMARDFDLLIIEDSPYRALRYVGESPPTMYSLDQDGRVISLFTFSKMLFPGLRLGWVVADPEIIARLALTKQPVDLCTSGLSQLVAREYLRTGRLQPQLARIRELYASKRQVMLDAFDRYVDPSWGVRWTRPEGGLFLWVTLPRWMTSHALFERALRENVAFVNGRAFHCDGSGQNTLRLNFSYPSHEQLDTAMQTLAGCIAEMVAERTVAPSEDAAEQVPATELLVGGDHALEQLAWNLALSELVE
jgi:2-aminoadipate transaminase